MVAVENWVPSKLHGLTGVKPVNTSTASVAQLNFRASYEGPFQSRDCFEIVEELHHTTGGVIYVAREKKTKTLYVLKRRRVAELGSAKDMLSEYELLRHLRHANVVQCYGYFWEFESRSLFVVLEYCGAGDLHKELKFRKRQSKPDHFKDSEVWDIFAQILSGLRYLHSKGIVHRDIKCMNLFLTNDGQIKIGDLGVSRQMSENTVFLNSFYGTPLYLSPELVEGLPYTQKTDMWSIGVVLYELLTLCPPFDGDSLKQVTNSVLRGRYQPIPFSRDPTFEWIVERLLQRSSSHRPTCEEVLQSLRKRVANFYNMVQASPGQAVSSGSEIKKNGGSRESKETKKSGRNGNKEKEEGNNIDNDNNDNDNDNGFRRGGNYHEYPQKVFPSSDSKPPDLGAGVVSWRGMERRPPIEEGRQLSKSHQAGSCVAGCLNWRENVTDVNQDRMREREGRPVRTPREGLPRSPSHGTPNRAAGRRTEFGRKGEGERRRPGDVEDGEFEMREIPITQRKNGINYDDNGHHPYDRGGIGRDKKGLNRIEDEREHHRRRGEEQKEEEKQKVRREGRFSAQSRSREPSITRDVKSRGNQRSQIDAVLFNKEERKVAERRSGDNNNSKENGKEREKRDDKSSRDNVRSRGRDDFGDLRYHGNYGKEPPIQYHADEPPAAGRHSWDGKRHRGAAEDYVDGDGENNGNNMKVIRIRRKNYNDEGSKNRQSQECNGAGTGAGVPEERDKRWEERRHAFHSRKDKLVPMTPSMDDDPSGLWRVKKFGEQQQLKEEKVSERERPWGNGNENRHIHRGESEHQKPRDRRYDNHWEPHARRRDKLIDEGRRDERNNHHHHRHDDYKNGQARSTSSIEKSAPPSRPSSRSPSRGRSPARIRSPSVEYYDRISGKVEYALRPPSKERRNVVHGPPSRGRVQRYDLIANRWID